MTAFEERRGAFADAGATVCSVNVDSPYSLNAFRDELGCRSACSATSSGRSSRRTTSRRTSRTAACTGSLIGR
ncbi:MAG: hypothetical protein ABEI96_00960 [Haloarculaceae archaeon]